jgi:hypothetical protein
MQIFLSWDILALYSMRSLVAFSSPNAVTIFPQKECIETLLGRDVDIVIKDRKKSRVGQMRIHHEYIIGLAVVCLVVGNPVHLKLAADKPVQYMADYLVAEAEEPLSYVGGVPALY